MDAESHILTTWQQDATAWTRAVRDQQIESRRLVTDRAVVDTVASYRPQSVLDLGCGEGWLCRELATRGRRVLGVDAVPDLIAQAQAAGGAAYRVSSYAATAQGSLADQGPFELIVSNFSLFGQASVEDLLRYLPQLLTPAGRLAIQTLHPGAGGADQPYRDGWRTGSWRGFSTDFVNPAPWYFRTLSGWVRLLVGSGFTVEALLEPVHPQTQQPASLILVGTPVGPPIPQP